MTDKIVVGVDGSPGSILALRWAADERRWLRRGLHVLVVLSVWWNLGLMAQFGMNTMDRQRLSLRENAWGVFVEVPRLAPSLAYRYLTDRASFYRAPRQ